MKETLSPKERLYATLDRETVDRIPVASPFQTATVVLMELCGVYWPKAFSNPEFMATLAYEAHRVIGFESVRVSSDMNVESEAMGCELNFEAGRNKGMDVQPPVKKPAMTAIDDFGSLKDPDPYKDGRMPVVLKAIGLIKKKVANTIPIFSMVVGPFTLAGQVRGLESFLRDLLKQPDCAKEVIERSYRVCLKFAQAQAEAGSDCVLIADPSASCDVISPKQFHNFAKMYAQNIASNIPVRSILHICGKTHLILAKMAEVTSAISIDSSVDIAEAKKIVGEKTAICGNVDVTNVLVLGKSEDVEKAVKECIAKGTDLLTTSCAISPVTPIANLKTMVETGKKFGWKVGSNERTIA